MASEELRKRLEALNGGPLAASPLPSDGTERKPKASSPRRGSDGSELPSVSAMVPPERTNPLDSSLQQHIPGEVRAVGKSGFYYHVEKSLATDGHLTIGTGLSVCNVLTSERFRDQLRRPVAVLPTDVLFLDLETLGLLGEPLFLVGMLTLADDGAATCHQLFARDLNEEASVLEKALSYLRSARLLVTYNGRSFDVPFLKSRFEQHGLRFPRVPAHVDLLMEARLRYRGRYRDCKLQTLERHLCGRGRTGDIPGARIPTVYRESILNRDAKQLAAILHHNLLDLATTAELISRFWAEEADSI